MDEYACWKKHTPLLYDLVITHARAWRRTGRGGIAPLSPPSPNLTPPFLPFRTAETPERL